jgi:hypothetical protein
MVVLVPVSITDGTHNNHGMSAKIISIIQMQQAWVTVIIPSIILDTLPILQATIKVIMATEISTITIRTTAMAIVAAVEVEDMAAEATGMVQMTNSHNSFHINSAQVKDNKPMVPLVKQDRSQQDLKQVQLLPMLVMSMNLAEKYATLLKRKMWRRMKPLTNPTTTTHLQLKMVPQKIPGRLKQKKKPKTYPRTSAMLLLNPFKPLMRLKLSLMCPMAFTTVLHREAALAICKLPL